MTKQPAESLLDHPVKPSEFFHRGGTGVGRRGFCVVFFFNFWTSYCLCYPPPLLRYPPIASTAFGSAIYVRSMRWSSFLLLEHDGVLNTVGIRVMHRPTWRFWMSFAYERVVNTDFNINFINFFDKDSKGGSRNVIGRHWCLLTAPIIPGSFSSSPLEL